ncbi:7TM diverse intracellular signaling domain-containing protein [Rhodoferax sp.]|uniref:sensor domain-containing diguanylate cyclase n=1 Tax=Rhodoferax sp. TaxID=50421 RepID=UPI0025E49FE8|nr:7TM diverse intracellular signaling domain-containing protein [Rhodoferax sp.]
MSYLFLRLLVALTLWSGAGWTAASAASSVAADTLSLSDNGTPPTLQGRTMQWLENGRTATATDALAAPFQAVESNQAIALDERNTLWIKLRLIRPAGSTGRWILNIPQPYLDHAVLFELQDGAWYPQTAGDTYAQRHWTMRGLYPEFELRLPPGQATDVLLQIRNFKPLPLPLRLAPTNYREGQRMMEFITLGLLFGLVLTLAILSLMRYAEFRNIPDLGAALYSVLIALTLAQFNGILNALLWPDSPMWADYANSVLPAVATGVALLFGRHLYSLHTHFRWFDRVLYGLGWAALVSITGYVVLDRAIADTVSGSIILLGTASGLLATWLNWRTGSTLGPWLLWTYTPQFAMALWMTLEAGGYLPTFWPMRYVLTLTVAASVPALVYALGRATHDRNEIAARAEHLPTQDALTGLLTSNAFETHLRDAYERAISHREPVALVLVTVVNHDHIRQTMGDPVAEQCLLRAVIKLHRVLRDVDPAARVGSAQFALLLEGMGSRQVLTERLVKLVASGLIPLQGLQPEVTLQFQAACVLLQENPIAPDNALRELAEVLAGISPRTRRPIRFLEPVPTQVASLHSALST